jgi:hypothetical protein
MLFAHETYQLHSILAARMSSTIVRASFVLPSSERSLIGANSVIADFFFKASVNLLTIQPMEEELLTSVCVAISMIHS